MIWAMIIADGVYSILYVDKEPFADSNKYRNNPTTTGGSPISVLITTIINCLPGKFFITKNAAKGIEIAHEMNTARTDTFKDNKTISI